MHNIYLYVRKAKPNQLAVEAVGAIRQLRYRSILIRGTMSNPSDCRLIFFSLSLSLSFQVRLSGAAARAALAFGF